MLASPGDFARRAHRLIQARSARASPHPQHCPSRKLEPPRCLSMPPPCICRKDASNSNLRRLRSLRSALDAWGCRPSDRRDAFRKPLQSRTIPGGSPCARTAGPKGIGKPNQGPLCILEVAEVCCSPWLQRSSSYTNKKSKCMCMCMYIYIYSCLQIDSF